MIIMNYDNRRLARKQNLLYMGKRNAREGREQYKGYEWVTNAVQ